MNSTTIALIPVTGFGALPTAAWIGMGPIHGPGVKVVRRREMGAEVRCGCIGPAQQ